MDPARAEEERTRAVVMRLLKALLVACAVVALWFVEHDDDDLAQAFGGAFLGLVVAFIALVARRRILWKNERPSYNVAALREPFSTARADVDAAIAALPAFEEDGLTYRPCAAQLRSGTVVERCVVVDADSFTLHWPDRAPVLPAIRIEYVVRVTASPSVLDRRHVERMVAASRAVAPDRRRFRFIFADGSNAILGIEHFLALPQMPLERAVDEVLDVLPAPATEPSHRSMPATVCVRTPRRSAG